MTRIISLFMCLLLGLLVTPDEAYPSGTEILPKVAYAQSMEDTTDTMDTADTTDTSDTSDATDSSDTTGNTADASVQSTSESHWQSPMPVAAKDYSQYSYKPGDTLEGYVVRDCLTLNTYDADCIVFEHEKTGALLLYFANEDPELYFTTGFRTHPGDDMGVPHVFEHTVLDGSEKYPPKDLFFNMTYQTYYTDLNAYTKNTLTEYIMGSRSEDQLLSFVDYYTDSTMHPLVLQDKNLFDEESWRYVLNSPEDELTITGTAYSEMKSNVSLASAAEYNLLGTLFPGSYASYDYGGNVKEMPNMTWQDLIDYYDRYYKPSNSLSCLYGKVEHPEAFLRLLDSYYSEYDREEADLEDHGYTPVTGHVVAEYNYALEAGSDTEDSSVVYYTFACDGIDREQTQALNYLADLLSEDSSLLMRNIQYTLPGIYVEIYADETLPVPSIHFVAEYIDPKQAETFCHIVDASLQQFAAKDTIDQDIIDIFRAEDKVSRLLLSETPTRGLDLCDSCLDEWSVYGNILSLYQEQDFSSQLDTWIKEGMFQNIVQQYLLNSEHTALVTTVPVAGLKEKEDQALREKLAKVKAGMSEEEITEIVERTKKNTAAATGATGASGASGAAGATNDSSEYIKKLQAVAVKNLPEDIPIFDISEEEGKNETMFLSAETATSGIAYQAIFLDASALSQKQIPYFQLYMDLLGTLDTKKHTREEIASLTRRYLSDFSATTYVPNILYEEGDLMIPYLQLDFLVLDEDVDKAYDLLYELLFETQFDDADALSDSVEDLLSFTEEEFYEYPDEHQLLEAHSHGYPNYAFLNSISNLNYYEILCEIAQLLEEDPEKVLNQLQKIQKTMHNRYGAISAVAGNKQSISLNRTASNAFLKRLDASATDPEEYSFDPVPKSQAIICDSLTNCNVLFADFTALGLEEYDAALGVLSRITLDTYLYPTLRSGYGVYAVDHYFDGDGWHFISYSDPNVRETFDVVSGLTDFASGLTSLDQETLDGYILSEYAANTLSDGALYDAMNAIVGYLEGSEQKDTLDYLRELKALTPKKLLKQVKLYDKFVHNYTSRSTAGFSDAIMQNKDLYDRIISPFQDDSEDTYVKHNGTHVTHDDHNSRDSHDNILDKFADFFAKYDDDYEDAYDDVPDKYDDDDDAYGDILGKFGRFFADYDDDYDDAYDDVPDKYDDDDDSYGDILGKFSRFFADYDDDYEDAYDDVPNKYDDDDDSYDDILDKLDDILDKYQDDDDSFNDILDKLDDILDKYDDDDDSYDDILDKYGDDDDSYEHLLDKLDDILDMYGDDDDPYDDILDKYDDDDVSFNDILNEYNDILDILDSYDDDCDTCDDACYVYDDDCDTCDDACYVYDDDCDACDDACYVYDDDCYACD